MCINGTYTYLAVNVSYVSACCNNVGS